MKLQLSSQNVLEYLAQHQLADLEEREQIKIELKSAKNFNLLIHLPNKYSFLIKQERFTKEGLVLGEFVREWEIFQREHLTCAMSINAYSSQKLENLEPDHKEK